MAQGDIETYRVPGGWGNRLQGTYSTQAEAAAVGRTTARFLRVEWFLRSRRGWWRLRNSYGNDPRKTKG